MDGDGFTLHWEEVRPATSGGVTSEEVIYGTVCTSYVKTEETIIADTDQIAAENLMYLSQDVVSFTDSTDLIADNVECVTEEVITDDWVVSDGQDRVEVPLGHLTNPLPDVKVENDIDVPLPTDQDEYTALRPWPCDFCSRRFRKKAALMNHMVAHQNDKPHACNLCGVRYIRKSELMNHLKVHAFVPENPDEMDYDDMLSSNQIVKPKKKRGRRKKKPEVEEENGSWENMTSARTQQWQRRSRPAPPAEPAPAPPTPPSPAPPSSPPSPPSPASSPPPPSPPTPPPTDPARPFVCKHCGIGFAREKALQSHSRVHGGDSPLECSQCGELCWSREALSAHCRRRHPQHRPAPPLPPPVHSDDEEDSEFRLSPEQSPPMSRAGSRAAAAGTAPELFCSHCGVAFQRADLLRRHVHAAHDYKRESSESWTEHRCEVCGEVCHDALQLLAHAELHTEDRHEPRASLKRGKNRNISNSSKQFPCRECGKVFGSRSSQQIHVRIHTGERPYGCRFCWKAFADGGTLRKHERIHTGEKPYACAVCPRAFNQRVVLREHVRSHHSAPDRARHGGTTYSCVVCGRAATSSADLVQHLIQHCDANTALTRQPQSGPRKYRRRRKAKLSVGSSRSASPAREWAEPASPPPAPSAPPAPRRARRRKAVELPRPRMIHTSPTLRPRIKQVRHRRPPRHPADDLRAIQPHLPPSAPPSAPSSPNEPEQETYEASIRGVSEDGPFKCEMCSLRFLERDDLLLHVPVHI